jgi:hypothetical protein
VRISQSLLSGLFFVAFGTATLTAGSPLEMGTAGDMGTGYTPRLLAYGLLVIGVLLLIKAALLSIATTRRSRTTMRPRPASSEGQDSCSITRVVTTATRRYRFRAPALRSLVIVTAMTVAFALLLPRLGLPLTVVALILASAIAGEKIRWPLLLALALGFAGLTTILFAYALRLQFPVWPA